MMRTNLETITESPPHLSIDPEQQLVEELSRIGDGRPLIFQGARLLRLSRELRSRGYTGQVTLNLSCGIVNSVRQEEWIDWRGVDRTT
jgi:hypothetical protein